MNFVIMAYSFPPRNGPECFCSGRFASALVSAGHSVHVITMDHPTAISDDVYNVIVDPRIKITRVPMREKKKRLWPRLRYLTTQWESADYPNAIRMLCNVLRQYDHPILISRSNPESSHIIAYHAHRLAAHWVAHFSDPIPFWSQVHGLKAKFWRALTIRWMRKTLQACDGVSLTCPEVIRYYHETYDKLFDAKPVFINYHVGEPPLKNDGRVWQKPFPEKFIVHMGMINPARGVLQLVEALDEINKKDVRIRFVQVGECAAAAMKLLSGRKDVLVLDSVDPGLGAAVANVADFCFVPDVQHDLDYTPFMPSKFVYLLFGNKPLVLLTRDDSPMARLSKQYPHSGLYMADYSRKGGLSTALQAALAAANEHMDRNAIRNLFTRANVADKFVANLTKAFSPKA